TTFGKNYERRFKDTDIFENIFQHILAEAIKKGFVDPKAVFVDSTHVKANANKKKFTKETLEIEMKAYQKDLEKEIAEDRENNGKKN
ncbi:MAG: IS5/IS1182 family transposase, partial [Proteocatella sp.]